MSEKILIAYYTDTGNTRELAELIGEFTQGELLEIHTKEIYPTEYNELVKVAKKQIEESYFPEIEKTEKKMENYSTVFVGTPIWWHTMAPPVATFLQEHDFSGKKIVPFYTHGGGGGGKTVKDIARFCPDAEILPDLGTYENTANKEQVQNWLKKIGVV